MDVVQAKRPQRPKGRPRVLPKDVDEWLLRDMAERADPATGLTSPCILDYASKLKVSTSTIKRVIRRLRDEGRLSLEYVESATMPGTQDAFYRVETPLAGNEQPSVSAPIES